jgi:glycosyltransferase involved in cell wall biosynthesis
MRILTLPKNLDVGGSQINSVDLAGALKACGHDVRVASLPGRLTSILANHGVPMEVIPNPDRRVSRIRAIARLIQQFDPQVIHAYEVREILDSTVASKLVSGAPVLGSIFSTRVPWYLPEATPITVGMPDLFDFTRRWRTGRVTLIDPPIPKVDPDPEVTAPGRDSLGDVRLIGLVSRLVEPFKKEGILRAISSMARLGREGFGLLIVGDGPARNLYETAAETTNGDTGKRVVSFAGPMTDPTPAFAAADVVVGNGTSITRAASLEIPSVVLGREGFSEIVSAATLEDLASRGFYGVGTGLSNPDPLPDQILASLDPHRSPELSTVRERILRRYGLDAVADCLDAELRLVSTFSLPSWTDIARCAVRNVHYRLRRLSLAAQADRLGLEAEVADNFVYGRLRNMALPPARFGTGRNC